MSGSASAKGENAFSITATSNEVAVRNRAGTLILKYQLKRPAHSKLSVDSACYFHPLATPSGTVITDLAPEDHLHHRGVFLAWVEMHGSKDADFWGWGEHAPTENRKIVNLGVAGTYAQGDLASFRVRNQWVATNEILLNEDLLVKMQKVDSVYVLDLVYTLVPQSQLTLSQWAFSGFCVRARKDGAAEIIGPDGPVNLPNPSHLKPESDWPPASWYALDLKLSDGGGAGVAVIDHIRNPPTRWHNNRDIRMLNPAITALGPVLLEAYTPTQLRYRIVTFDGPPPQDLLRRLAKGWEKDSLF
jgi:Family of unknown function (DUF6807)